jgi:putative addiction module component (TIGR02574 family)
MSSKVPLPPPGFDELSTDDQIEYLQDLWDCITSREDEVSIPDWHLEILEERLARYNTNGMEGTTLEDFEKELIEQLMKG